MSTFYSSGNTDIKKWALLPSQKVVSVLPVEWKVDFSVFGFYDDFNENSSYYSLRDTDFQKSSARVAIFKSHFPTYMGPQSLNIQEYSWNWLYLLNEVHHSATAVSGAHYDRRGRNVLYEWSFTFVSTCLSKTPL